MYTIRPLASFFLDTFWHVHQLIRTWYQTPVRPLLCTEYMARPMDSTFENILPLFATEHVGGYNWGFVNGKMQTIHSWTSWVFSDEGEPELWFHDVLQSDGTPYDPADIEAIQNFLSGY